MSIFGSERQAVKDTLSLAREKMAQADVPGANAAIAQALSLMDKSEDVIAHLDAVVQAVPVQFRDAVTAALKLIASPAAAADRTVQRVSAAIQTWDDGVTIDLQNVKANDWLLSGAIRITPIATRQAK